MAAAVGTNQFGLDAELFTRGTGDGARGPSMVEMHMEKMQQEKEAAAIEKLSALMPQLGEQVRVLALKETSFVVDAALGLLRAFQAQNDEKVKAIQKRRKKLQDSEAEAVAQAEADAVQSSSDDSSSSSDSSDDSDSDSGRGKGKRKRSSSKRSKKSSKKKRKRSSKKDKKDSRDSKKRKKDKDKAKAGGMTHSEDFGKYGIIRETDAAAKRSEFTLWALDVKKVDVETLSRPDERELFKDFIEDFNTGTLPHRKYYNLELYERERMAKMAKKHGAAAAKAGAAKPVALGDEEALRQQREEERAKAAQERMAAAYAELQQGDKARDMREQEMLRLQMQVAYKTGDIKKAQQLQNLLMPDEEKRAKGLIK